MKHEDARAFDMRSAEAAHRTYRERSEGGAGGRTIQSVDRALTILEEIANETDGLSLSRIAEVTGLNVSTCHHLLSTLVSRGYVTNAGRSRGYVLGSKVRDLLDVSERQKDPAMLLKSDLEALGRRIGHGVQLAVLSETLLMTKIKFNAPDQQIEEPDEVDKMTALHATATGKAILAWIPDTELVQVISANGLTRYTDKTITSLSGLVEELRLVRRRQFAIDDEEFREGIVCIGAAIRKSGGAVVASISATMPAEQATPVYRDQIVKEMILAANQFSSRLLKAER